MGLRLAVLASLAGSPEEYEPNTPPMRSKGRFGDRKLTSAGKYGVLYLNVYDTSSSSENFINRQFKAFSSGNCAVNTYFGTQMTSLTNKPPEKLVADFYNCFPSTGGAVQTAIGIAVANTAMVEEFAIMITVLAIVFISKNVLKKDEVSFEDDQIEGKLYDMAHKVLLEEHKLKENNGNPM